MPKTPERRPSYDELAALVVRQMATIEAQRETIARLEETVDRLTARVVELERRLGRNSGHRHVVDLMGLVRRCAVERGYLRR